MRGAGALAGLALLGAAPVPAPAGYLADARALDAEIASTYAYLDRFGGTVPGSTALTAEREAVHDRDSLLHYAEDRLFALADHHAITGRSFPDSWAVVPTYADLWVVADPHGYRIDALREGSPAAVAGIVVGDRLVAVAGQPIATAVAAFWAPIGRPVAADADAFAARVLAAGRRDRPRDLTIAGRDGERRLTLASLYAAAHDEPPVTLTGAPGRATIRLGNSLGDQATIAAFDAAMVQLPDRARLVLDLTDTPSGGNTSVARAIMGWFVDRATGYQVHNLVGEERETGIGRQWIEQVLPRAGKRHHGPVEVRVGRWTGSMGEGLAIGMAATGATVCGTAMAGLRGAVYDVKLPATGLVVKLPAERLATVTGMPREDYRPPACHG